MDDLKEHAKAKLLISTLQKYGYDLQDPMLMDDPDSPGAAASANASALDGLPSPSSLDESYAPRPSTFSSASILQLRERRNNQTALHIAVKKGHIDVLRALAKLPRVQDHVNAGDKHANTALHFAASSAKECAPEMVELLLGMSANVNAVNVRGQTPLAIHILTARQDNPSIAKQLVKKSEEGEGMELNALINGTTYLHMATENNLLEIAGALVAGGASINVPDHNGASVGDVIPKKSLVKLILFMKEGTQASPRDVKHKCCKICKNPKGLLETLKECNLCGRAVCKNDSQKASEIHAKLQEGGDSLTYQQKKASDKEKETGRLCTVCCTVVLLRDKKLKAKEGFNQKLYGFGMISTLAGNRVVAQVRERDDGEDHAQVRHGEREAAVVEARAAVVEVRLADLVEEETRNGDREDVARERADERHDHAQILGCNRQQVRDEHEEHGDHRAERQTLAVVTQERELHRLAQRLERHRRLEHHARAEAEARAVDQRVVRAEAREDVARRVAVEAHVAEHREQDVGHERRADERLVHALHRLLVVDLLVRARHVELAREAERDDRQRVRDRRRLGRELARRVRLNRRGKVRVVLDRAHREREQDVQDAEDHEQVHVAQLVDRLGKAQWDRHHREHEPDRAAREHVHEERLEEVHRDDHVRHDRAEEQDEREDAHSPDARGTKQARAQRLVRKLGRGIARDRDDLERLVRDPTGEQEDRDRRHDAHSLHRAGERQDARTHHRRRQPEKGRERRALLAVARRRVRRDDLLHLVRRLVRRALQLVARVLQQLGHLVQRHRRRR